MANPGETDLSPRKSAGKSAGKSERRRSLGCRGIAIGGLILFAIGVVTIGVIRARGLPTVDRQRFEDARRNWRRIEPRGYDIEVRVAGRQAALYRVEVRDREVARAFRNGRPLTQMRTLGTWSVPGMFETIETDLEQQDLARRGVADWAIPGLTLFAEFDADFSFPRRYIRLEHAGMGTNPEVTWEVTEFTIVEGP